MIGIGLSSLFPLVFRAASELTHGSHSGMASFSAGARLGFLMASPLMGLIAGRSSVAVALVVVAGTAATVVAVRRLPRVAGARARRRALDGLTAGPTARRRPLRHPFPNVTRTDILLAHRPLGGGPMSMFCTTHGLPRAGLDPIDSSPAALAVVELALHRPLVHQTIALVLEADRRGRTVLVVDGTDEPDAVLDVVERVVDSIAATGRTGCLVVATARPGGGPVEGDDDRWLGRQRPRRRGGRRSPRVVRRRCRRRAAAGRRVVPARPRRRAAAVEQVVSRGARQPARARRWAGVRRRPAARSRRTSSRLSTSTAPASTIAGRCSSGMS